MTIDWHVINYHAGNVALVLAVLVAVVTMWLVFERIVKWLIEMFVQLATSNRRKP